MTTEEREIEKLRRQLESMGREVERLKAESRRKEKHVRDSFLGAILGGLLVGWKAEDSPQAFADLAERILEAVMRNRARWESVQSANTPPKPSSRGVVAVTRNGTNGSKP